ncbi:hypothetical protein [Croceibacter atlanticus]|uniref:hypothetical protein n=2 Tax=Croceibacter atlanticus TaxID=313588 RepID=UPI0024BA16F7|nr:hypothetical protein [Croceibacter atlanticus]
MIYQKVIMKIGFVLILGLTVVSCNKNEKKATVSETQKSVSIEKPKTDTKLKIEDYFSGPNYMRYMVSENNQLALTDKQELAFKIWRTENHPKIEAKMSRIDEINSEIKSLSKEQASSEKILQKLDATNKLRLEIAETKIQCRDHIIEELDDKQWNTLVEDYKKGYPFKEREEMMVLISHVNPLPNYMQTINDNTTNFKISEEQQKTLGNWSGENHPKMMQMAQQIQNLEKEIYQASLNKEPKTGILNQINEIGKLRVNVVSKKTNCRDLVIKTLSPEQWNLLIEKS